MLEPTEKQTGFIHESNILENNIEFVGIVDNKGRIGDYVSRAEIRIPKEKLEMFFMSLSLQNAMQKDFDDELGDVKHIVIQRENLKIVSIPIHTGSIVAMMSLTADHSTFVKEIVTKLNHSE